MPEDTTIDSNLTVTGDHTVEGDHTVTGDTTVGNITATGTVTGFGGGDDLGDLADINSVTATPDAQIPVHIRSGGFAANAITNLPSAGQSAVMFILNGNGVSSITITNLGPGANETLTIPSGEGGIIAYNTSSESWFAVGASPNSTYA